MYTFTVITKMIHVHGVIHHGAIFSFLAAHILQSNRVCSTVIGLYFGAHNIHVSCLQAIEGRFEHAYCTVIT